MNDASMPAVQVLAALDDRSRVVTIGNFDGVHKGHQHLLALVTARARHLNVASLVLTFEPHPVSVLRPEHAPLRIATPDDKIRRLKDYGIDEVAVIPFDRAFASLSPDEFLSLIVTYLHPCALYVGQGFRFGKMRAGDTGTIEQFGQTHGFECHTVEPLSDAAGVVSSSRVRDALTNGDIATATHLLGRRFRLSGSVEHGMARGRDLGYPTANIGVPEGFCVPHDGIYAGYARFDEQPDTVHEALIYIGTSPTFGDRARLVEVNILDFQGDLYGHEIEIEFVDFVRGDRVFESTEALMEQMVNDEKTTREVLSSTASEPRVRGN